MKSAEQWLQEGYEKYNQGNFEGTITALRNIRREDSIETYAEAQLLLGMTLDQQGDLDGAISTFRNIQRDDSAEVYIESQLALGILLPRQGDFNGGITVLRNIQRENSVGKYAAWAKFTLGELLLQQEEIDGAIAAFRSIQRKDSVETYAKAQLLLGMTLDQQGNFEDAITAFKNIQSEDSIEIYTQAQFALGMILFQQNDFNGAITALRKIQRKDSIEIYAQAQLFLGISLGQQGYLDKAVPILQNIQREDSKEAYARAQFTLGIFLPQQLGITAFNSIQREDSLEIYAEAQFNVGVILSKKGDVNGAIAAYRNIQPDDLKEIYIKAQVNLGDALYKKGNIEEAITTYKNILNDRYFEAKSAIQALKCNEKYHKDLMEIRKVILDLMKELLVLSTNKLKLKVAHYTRGSTVWKMIGEQKPSAFRLNTIKNVNDPMEGLVLNRYLQKYCQISNGLLFNNAIENIEHQLGSVFISCFTFNHDSLNQFRLYGKEEEQEASGVSLVFSDNFFNSDQEDSLNFIASNKNIEINDKNLSNQALPKNTEEPNNVKLLNKQPLYRCIYIDPDTGYLSLACRDQITFYGEILAKDLTQGLDEISSEAKKQWRIYQKGISDKEKAIQKYLKNLGTHLKRLKRNIEKLSQQDKAKVSEVLNFILLPLQYLVKHAAFQEEQECRIIYITELSDEKIQMDYGSKQMYVGYQPNVKENIDKIYLSPGAKAHEDFFRKVLNDTQPKKKVRISTNPFRNK